MYHFLLDIYFDNLGQFVIATYKPKTPNVIIDIIFI